jgi:rhodanese-related sulfurtransferase
MKQLNPTELDAFLADNTAVMIDVRESHELAHGMIEGAQHIPMNDVPVRIAELEPHKTETIVLICRSGKRSAQVGQYLEQLGFSDIINLDGGMNGWAADVDSSMTVY